jgi:hypothetical protein
MQEPKMMLGLRPLNKKFTMRSSRKKRHLPVMKKYRPHVRNFTIYIPCLLLYPRWNHLHQQRSRRRDRPAADKKPSTT